MHAFLDSPVEGSAALELEGEAGIGKSTLWLAGVAAAREREFRVLVSRPAEAERALTHAGLGDLLAEFLVELYVPDDETCFYVYEAASVDAVTRAVSRAVVATNESPMRSSSRTGKSRESL